MSDRIVIAGAGSIGCFVGGLFAIGGREIVLLARPRIAAELREYGLTLASFEGWSERIAPSALASRPTPGERWRAPGPYWSRSRAARPRRWPRSSPRTPRGKPR